MLRFLLTALLLHCTCGPALTAQVDSTIYLWPAGAPCTGATTDRTVVKEDIGLVYESIGAPRLHLYRSLGRLHDSTALLIIPGGAYTVEAYDWEGRDPARFFNRYGVTAFVLLHRLPHKVPDSCRATVALADARRAMEHLRANAGHYGLRPDRIGIMGFSAGGHLAASTSVHHTAAGRPDFSVLVYPVINMEGGASEHSYSRQGLTGEPANDTVREYYHLPPHVDASTPPAILFHAADDRGVPPDNSIAYFRQLHAAGVPAALHLFTSGGHGFGMAGWMSAYNHKWPEMALAWIRDLHSRP